MIDKGPENWYEEGGLSRFLNPAAPRPDNRFPRCLPVDGRPGQRYLRAPRLVCSPTWPKTALQRCGTRDPRPRPCVVWLGSRNGPARLLAPPALFPPLPSRPRFTRRRRAVQDAFALLRQALLAVRDLADDTPGIMESLPMPVVSRPPQPAPHGAQAPPRSRPSVASHSTSSSPGTASSATLRWLPRR